MRGTIVSLEMILFTLLYMMPKVAQAKLKYLMMQ